MKSMMRVLFIFSKKAIGVLCLLIFIGSFGRLWFYQYASIEVTTTTFSKERLIDFGNVWGSEGTVLHVENGKLSKASSFGSYIQASTLMVGVGNILWIASSSASLLAGILLLKRQK